MIEDLFSIPILYEVIPGERNVFVSQEVERALVEERKLANSNIWNNEIDTTFHETTSIISKYSMSALDDTIFEYVSTMSSAIANDSEERTTFGLEITNSWFNIGKPGSFQFDHVHHGHRGHNALSGVYYHKVPENGGSIIFQNPISHLTVCNKLWDLSISPVKGLEPMEGSILIFPSFLSHKVGINQSNEERISISFNVVMNVLNEE